MNQQIHYLAKRRISKARCLLNTVTRFHCLLLLLALVGPTSVRAADQCTGKVSSPIYEVTAVSGSPVAITKDFSYTRKNGSSVLIRLEDINPFAFKCTVSTSSQAFPETAIASFLGLIGGVANVGASTSDPSKPLKAGLTSALDPCTADMQEKLKHVTDLRNAINAALEATRKEAQSMVDQFNDNKNGVPGLRTRTACNDIVAQATALANMPLFKTHTVEVGPASQIPLSQAIDQIAQEAQALLPHISDSCKGRSQSDIAQDSAFLAAIAHGTSLIPAAADQWRDQLKNLNTVRDNLDNVQQGITAVLAHPENFIIDTEIQGSQKQVTVNISCTPVVSDLKPADISKPVAGGNPWSRDFRFGVGPRFVYAGGLVVSPLAQITFSTSANPAASSGSGLPANIIVNQQKSDTRLLPIAMLHSRFWDQLPAHAWKAWLPNYLSAGVTAKPSDNKGTSIEYLFGPSWSFAERQIFFTAGAYAGQQQRLGGSLTVGQATSLSSSNLPITQSTIWKVGFAVTWAPGGK